MINPANKNENPEYGGMVNLNPKDPKLNNLKNHSSSKSKSGSFLKIDNKHSTEAAESKIIEELTTLVKHKISSRNNSTTPTKFDLNMKPYLKNVSTQLDELLSENFDIFQFHKECYHNSVVLLMTYFYNFYRWDQLHISESKFMNLIYNIQKNYNDNPYHNSIHAADVTNTSFYMLEKLDLRNSLGYTNIEVLSVILSCAAHDVDHPGNNNSYEINNRTLLSLTYNDKSVLENYHLFLFFNFLLNDSMNIYSEFEDAQVKTIRKVFISNIIATDLLNHKNDLNKLSELTKSTNWDPKKQENKDFIQSQIVHFCDISNSAKPFPIYKQWVDRLFIEFFKQGDKEKELGLPISMLCDREKTVIPDSQVFFIGFIIMDLTKSFATAFPNFNAMVDALEYNKSLWEKEKGKPYELKEEE